MTSITRKVTVSLSEFDDDDLVDECSFRGLFESNSRCISELLAADLMAACVDGLARKGLIPDGVTTRQATYQFLLDAFIGYTNRDADRITALQYVSAGENPIYPHLARLAS